MQDKLATTIADVSRRAIVDYLSVLQNWSGAFEEDGFLGRLYNLGKMPSNDRRQEYDATAKDNANRPFAAL